MTEYTKIIATIGPASIGEETLEAMIQAGVNCVRINTAHGDFDQYKTILERVENLQGVATMLDIKGPQIRIVLETPKTVEEGETFRVSFNDSFLPRLNYDVYDDVAVGDDVYFDEGYVHTTIVGKTDDRALELRAEHDAMIKPDKGVNIPGKELDLPSLNDKDKECIRFARQNNVDYIAQSFVRRAEDIEETRSRLGDEPTKVIAKIENHEGVDNLDEIIDESDGVMIARGDLGVELPQQRIPAVQKEIVRKTAQQSNVSIVATQMLESMTDSPKPTRAEISDVANAVLDGADAVMLSGETAVGAYPVEAVSTMRDTAKEIESDISMSIELNGGESLSEEMSKAAHTVAEQPPVDKVVVLGSGTKQTRLLSRYRLCKPLISVTDTPRVARQLHLVWGVKPLLIEDLPEEYIIPTVAKHAYDEGLLDADDTVVFYAGVGTDDHEEGNLVEAHTIKDFFDYHNLLE